MEHSHEPNGGVLATIGFAIVSLVFKGGGIIGVDTYILLPLAHLVSIIAGTCAIISFLFVLHPPLKNGLINAVSTAIDALVFAGNFIKQLFK